MTPREFALDVVHKLQEAGFQALWAGGCVRDQIVGHEPKDYDVATDAKPDEVRNVFGNKRTLPIGASFGVITVLGPKSAEPIEVATFRSDSVYSDGRRPDSIEFTDARQDALRRDFTINGMFYDPITDQVLDYVGGEADLAAKMIRAIGDPHERIREDKLRMLRGIRFASTFDFELEPGTLLAIQAHATEISVVSGERIGAEMRRMLGSPRRATATRLLQESHLLAEIIPDGLSLVADHEEWQRTVARLDRLDGNFESAATILLEPIIEQKGIDVISNRWKLSNRECKSISWISRHWRQLEKADRLPWSEVQPLLVHRDGSSGLAVAAAYRETPSAGVDYCRQRIAWPIEKLDPKPFLDGGDLIKLGIANGPLFKRILDSVRTAQLDGKIDSVDEAKAIAKGLAD